MKNLTMKVYTVNTSSHDCDSKSVIVLRKDTQKQAERTARLMTECGYRKVAIEAKIA